MLTKTRTLLALGLAALAVPAAAAQYGKQHADHAHDEVKPFEIGKEVDKAIALTDIDGTEHSFEQYRGKVLVLDFWSVNCPWSKKYEAKLKELATAFAEQDVVFLAIDSNHTEVQEGAEDPYAAIREYHEKEELPYPVLMDHGNVIADRFAAKTTPHCYVIDAKGFLRYDGGVDNDPKGEKVDDEYEPWLASAIEAVLAGEEVTNAKTKAFGCSIKRVEKQHAH